MFVIEKIELGFVFKLYGEHTFTGCAGCVIYIDRQWCCDLVVLHKLTGSGAVIWLCYIF